MKIILLAILFASSFVGLSQSLPDIKFSQYKTPVFSSLKTAKIDFKSSKTARQFRTILTENYKNAKPDFASYYKTVIWGCGIGCIAGAMIDFRDGKVYDLPINPNNTYGGCFTNASNDDKEDRFEINKNSALFLTNNCQEEQSETNNKVKQTKTFFIFIWDEKVKKFKFQKKNTRKRNIKNREE